MIIFSLKHFHKHLPHNPITYFKFSFRKQQNTIYHQNPSSPVSNSNIIATFHSETNVQTIFEVKEWHLLFAIYHKFKIISLANFFLGHTKKVKTIQRDKAQHFPFSIWHDL